MTSQRVAKVIEDTCKEHGLVCTAHKGARGGLPGIVVELPGERRLKTNTILSIGEGPVAPNWPTGIALGIGGIVGGYTGARIQSRLPDTLIRRVVGVLAIAIAAQYLWSGLT